MVYYSIKITEHIGMPLELEFLQYLHQFSRMMLCNMQVLH